MDFHQTWYVHWYCGDLVLVYPALASLGAVEDRCDQRRLWSDCADVQVDLSLRWSHKSYRRFGRALPHIIFNYRYKSRREWKERSRRKQGSWCCRCGKQINNTREYVLKCKIFSVCVCVCVCLRLEYKGNKSCFFFIIVFYQLCV